MNSRLKTERAPSFSPCDLDSERRALGILIKFPAKADLVVDRLKPEHFSDPVHRRVYEAILELYNLQGRISYTQVYNRLRRDPSLTMPDQLLLGLIESFVSDGELEPSVATLVDKYGRRRILEACEQVKQMILDDVLESLDSCRSRAQELMFRATGLDLDGPESDVKNLVDVLRKCYLRLLERQEGKKPYGLNVGYPDIYAITQGGLKNKDLIVLAGRPSMGKTALALNFVVNAARRGVPALIFSLEMDDEQIGDRIVISELFKFRSSSSGQVTAQDYAMRMDEEKFSRTQSVFSELFKLPIKVVDRRGMSVAEMRAKARRVKAEDPGLGLIVIDYLQLIRPPVEMNKNWSLAVGDVVREIRDLAGELNLPVILLSQLNRGVESRDNKRPMMSDLRDSGNIEEFADVVMFLYREDYYYPEQARQKGLEGVVEVIIAKQRKGPTGQTNLKFYREYTRFVEEETKRLEVPASAS
ncbi:MAG: replicative DNA helicase [Firmicutes bacterium]|nr:replicative DNA helicase [Bacillota bacterium]